MNRNVPDKQEKSCRLMAYFGGPRAPVVGGDSREKSGKTPPGPRRGCDNLGPLRGTKTMHRYTHARALLSLAATLGAALVAAACGSATAVVRLGYPATRSARRAWRRRPRPGSESWAARS